MPDLHKILSSVAHCSVQGSIMCAALSDFMLAWICVPGCMKTNYRAVINRFFSSLLPALLTILRDHARMRLSEGGPHCSLQHPHEGRWRCRHWSLLSGDQ